MRAGTGRVVASKLWSSTVQTQAVGQCIRRSAVGWLFPKPKGGGIVIVQYPFVLRTTGRAARPREDPASKRVPPVKSDDPLDGLPNL